MATKARAITSWALSAFKARDKTTMLTLYKSLVRSHYPNLNTTVHFGTVIKSQIYKSSREFKKHLLPGYGDCNIWIIAAFQDS